MTSSKKTTTRFAPSPTGWLHIGGVRTALYAYLHAKQHDGDFILRIEDTDQSRYVEGAVSDILDGLYNLGIKPNQGVILNNDHLPAERGKHAPYYQSKRLDTYLEYAHQLIDQGDAYYCFCSADRLEKLRRQQADNKQAPRYDGHCRKLSPQDVAAKLKAEQPHVIRLKVPQHESIVFNDIVRGEVSFETQQIDDQVLIKSDGFPTYHLAVVVDDFLMQVTHVIRGEEWLSSTPKHVLIYQALGWDLPQFVHLPLILNKDKSKLSKRSGDVALKDYLHKGYLSAAIINYIALLGWNPKNNAEMFSMQDLLQEFKLENINKAGAVFDIEKLNWYNSQYYQQMDLHEFYQQSLQWLQKNEPQFAKTYNIFVAQAAQTRVHNFAHIVGEFNHIALLDIDYPAKDLIFRKSDLDKTQQGLKLAQLMIQDNTSQIWHENIEQQAGDEQLVQSIVDLFSQYIKENNLSNGDVFWPLRYALSGKDKSESPAELLLELGRDESLRRIDIALEKLTHLDK